MAIKVGVKETEVGPIPEDWRVVTIDDISVVGRGRVISHREISRSRDPRYPVYSSQTANDGVMGYLDSFEFSGEYITWTTDGANAGTVFARDGRFNCTNVCGTIKLFSDHTPFVAAVLGQFSKSYVTRHVGNPKLMNDVMKRVKIPLPPTESEQRAIAEVLRDADAYIASLEQLLAKKRDIKQGAMQDLLTGKRRLPGFLGEWESKPLENVCNVVMGQSPPSMYYNHVGDGLPLIQGAADIVGRQTTKRYYSTHSPKKAPAGAILMSVRAPVGEIAKTTFDVCLGRGMCAFAAPNDFLYHALVAKESCWSTLSKGSTFDSVTSQDVRTFRIDIPKDRVEQEAISEVLSAMDDELVELELRISKARDIKQGVMKELLSGKTRLV